MPESEYRRHRINSFRLSFVPYTLDFFLAKEYVLWHDHTLSNSHPISGSLLFFPPPVSFFCNPSPSCSVFSVFSAFQIVWISFSGAGDSVSQPNLLSEVVSQGTHGRRDNSKISDAVTATDKSFAILSLSLL